MPPSRLFACRAALLVLPLSVFQAPTADTSTALLPARRHTRAVVRRWEGSLPNNVVVAAAARQLDLLVKQANAENRLVMLNLFTEDW